MCGSNHCVIIGVFMGKLYLIRHGRTEANEKWLYCGATDLTLSESGKKDLEKVHCEIPGNPLFMTSGMKRTEETLKILPASLKEAGLALGGNKARVMMKVQLPAAFGGIFTGVLLAISRVIGETAPLMFTALGCSLIRFSIDKPISAVPLLIWEFFNDPNLQELIWGASLFLLLFVLTLNLLSKYLAKKWNH